MRYDCIAESIIAKRFRTAIINLNNATDGEEGSDLRGFDGLISSLTLYERAIVQDINIHGELIVKKDGEYTLRGHVVDEGAVKELIAADYLEEKEDGIGFSGMFEAKKRIYTAAESIVASVTFDKLDRDEALRIAWRVNCMLADEKEMLGFSYGGSPTWNLVSAINDDGIFDTTSHLFEEYLQRSGLVAAYNIQYIYDANWGPEKMAKLSEEQEREVPGLLRLIMSCVNFGLVRRIDTSKLDDFMLKCIRGLVGAEQRWYAGAPGKMYTVEAVLYGAGQGGPGSYGPANDLTEYGRHVFSFRCVDAGRAIELAKEHYAAFFPDSDYEVEYEITEQV